MRRHRERGSAVIADIVLGAVITLIVAASASAAGVLTAAAGENREAARHAALWAARTADEVYAEGIARRLAPRSSVSVSTTSGTARATVSGTVRLPYPIAGGIRITLTESVAIPIAPYRSNRGG